MYNSSISMDLALVRWISFHLVALPPQLLTSKKIIS